MKSYPLKGSGLVASDGRPVLIDPATGHGLVLSTAGDSRPIQLETSGAGSAVSGAIDSPYLFAVGTRSADLDVTDVRRWPHRRGGKCGRFLQRTGAVRPPR